MALAGVTDQIVYLDEGDVVRIFRRTMDLLEQIAREHPGLDTVRIDTADPAQAKPAIAVTTDFGAELAASAPTAAEPKSLIRRMAGSCSRVTWSASFSTAVLSSSTAKTMCSAEKAIEITIMRRTLPPFTTVSEIQSCPSRVT